MTRQFGRKLPRNLNQVGPYARSVVQKIFPFHTGAWWIAMSTFEGVLDAPSDAEQEQRLQIWRESTLAQLSMVGLIGAVITAATVGLFTWPILGSFESHTKTTIQILWYISVILAVTAVSVSLHQGVFLLRVQAAPNSCGLMVRLLSYETSAGLSQAKERARDSLAMCYGAVGVQHLLLVGWATGVSLGLLAAV